MSLKFKQEIQLSQVLKFFRYFEIYNVKSFFCNFFYKKSCKLRNFTSSINFSVSCQKCKFIAISSR